MAISGAAASPKYGINVAATGLFMTLFDVRLGWWIEIRALAKNGEAPAPSLAWGICFPN
jgi:hypothetical protein